MVTSTFNRSGKQGSISSFRERHQIFVVSHSHLHILDMRTSPEGLSNFPRITGRAEFGPRFLLPLSLQSLLWKNLWTGHCSHRITREGCHQEKPATHQGLSHTMISLTWSAHFPFGSIGSTFAFVKVVYVSQESVMEGIYYKFWCKGFIIRIKT